MTLKKIYETSKMRLVRIFVITLRVENSNFKNLKEGLIITMEKTILTKDSIYNLFEKF